MSVSVPLHVSLRQSGDRRVIITGSVVAVNAGDVTATVDVDGFGSEIEAPYLGSAPSVGDVAALVRSGNRLWMIGVYGTTTYVPAETPGADEPVPPPEPSITKATLRPTATGTARGGSVRGDTSQLYQGDWTGRGNNSGMAVYRAKQLSGNVTRAVLRIKRLDAGSYAAQSPTLRLMNQSSLVGSPTWQASLSGPAMKVGEVRTVTLPDWWGQRLINGSAGGIGIEDGSSPYVRLAGKAEGFMTLTLTIKE